MGARQASPALAVTLAVAAAVALGSCNENLAIENAATDPAELARYFPESTQLVQTTDVAEVRQELGLPDDADATPTQRSVLRDRESPQSKLFALTSRAFPIVSRAYALEFEASGSSPLDGTLIRAAAHDNGDLMIVSTAEPFDQVADKLKRTGYSLDRGIYLAGPDTPRVAPPVVADGGSGRIVFTGSEGLARSTLRRMEERAEGGTAAEALQAVSGSVKRAITAIRSRCVEAIAAAQSATGRGAILAIEVAGEKPDTDRFYPRALKGLDTGTTSVLVDSLLVPFNVKRQVGRAREPIDVLFSYSEIIQVPAGGHFTFGRPPSPADAYDCPE